MAKRTDWDIELPDPATCVTVEQQRNYHRMLQRKYAAMPELPSAIWEMPFPPPGAPQE
jgi:hypothetical protein